MSDYVRATGRVPLTRLYDPVVALTMREHTFRARLQERIARHLPAGGTVVDVGCGTGTFAIALARARPDATVIGLDGDAGILRRAAAKTGADVVEWREGLATDVVPADAIVMSLLLHHLSPEDKRSALAAARRALDPAGSLHVADWGRPDALTRPGFVALRLLDGFANTRDHAEGRLPGLIRAAGFDDPERHARLRTPFGSLELLVATL